MRKLKATPRAGARLSDEAQTHARLLGAALRAARTRQGLTRRELANRLLIGPATLQRMETGDARVSLGYYLTMADHLGLPAFATQVSAQPLAALIPATGQRAARKTGRKDWFKN